MNQLIPDKSKCCEVLAWPSIKLYTIGGEVYFEGPVVKLLRFVQRRNNLINKNGIIMDHRVVYNLILIPHRQVKHINHLEYVVTIKDKNGEKTTEKVDTIYALVNSIDWSNPIAQVVFVTGYYCDYSRICFKKWYAYCGLVFAFRIQNKDTRSDWVLRDKDTRSDWVLRDSIQDTWIEVIKGSDKWCPPEYFCNGIQSTWITFSPGTDKWCPHEYLLGDED